MELETDLLSRVYRLKGIPEDLDRLEVAKLLADFLPSRDASNVTVASLSPSCDFWSRSTTKTATLTFSELPTHVHAAPSATEWQIHLSGLVDPLILDVAFRGLTPLNAVPPGDHQLE